MGVEAAKLIGEALGQHKEFEVSAQSSSDFNLGSNPNYHFCDEATLPIRHDGSTGYFFINLCYTIFCLHRLCSRRLAHITS